MSIIVGAAEVAVTRKHLEQVIKYLYQDEERNYEEADNPKEHIFVSIKHLRRQMERQPQR